MQEPLSFVPYTFVTNTLGNQNARMGGRLPPLARGYRPAAGRGLRVPNTQLARICLLHVLAPDAWIRGNEFFQSRGAGRF